jgi:hypothetical protein
VRVPGGGPDLLHQQVLFHHRLEPLGVSHWRYRADG